MKKMYFLLCLVCFSVQAKYYKAVLTLEDGSAKKGFAEMVEWSDSKVKFKLEEKGDTEKILSTSLKKIEYTGDEKNVFIAERLYIQTDKGEKGVKISPEKYWLYVVYSKGIKLAVNVYQSTQIFNANTGMTKGQAGGRSFYLGKEKEDAIFFICFISDMNSTTIGMDKSVRKHCSLLFKDCPKFIEVVNAEDFKQASLMSRIVELYEEHNCNKSVTVNIQKQKNSKNKK